MRSLKDTTHRVERVQVARKTKSDEALSIGKDGDHMDNTSIFGTSSYDAHLIGADKR
jgi:hypothetical protein